MSRVKDIEDVIVAGSQTKIFTRIGSGDGEKNLKDLRGILESDYSSIELEEKADEWRAELSD